MKTKHKALLLCLCAVMLVAASVMGTIAYLTSADTVVNTFAVGDVIIELDEADVNEDGTYVTDHDNRVQENEYHLLPGHTYFKDPTVTVKAKSEDSFVRMMVKVEDLSQLEAALSNSGDSAKYYSKDGLFLLQMLCLDKDGNNTWNETEWPFETYHTTGDYAGCYEFRHNGIVPKADTDTVLGDLFTDITLPAEVDNDHLEYLEGLKITVNAHAIQADGFEGDADKAWAAFG